MPLRSWVPLELCYFVMVANTVASTGIFCRAWTLVSATVDTTFAPSGVSTSHRGGKPERLEISQLHPLDTRMPTEVHCRPDIVNAACVTRWPEVLHYNDDSTSSQDQCVSMWHM